MPTRDARHGRLYQFSKGNAGSIADLPDKWLKYMYINDQEHIKNPGPLSDGCDCLTCTRYSRGYLHHLFKMNDSLFLRLATIHNLRFMTQLTERIREITA
jgi:queuine tRNA-ribosyltransferase